jgi:hypothetical protein
VKAVVMRVPVWVKKIAEAIAALAAVIVTTLF